MIVIEKYKTRADGVELIRTYSDEGYRIIRNDGVVYDEAIDVKDSGYTYEESEELIEVEIPEEEIPDEPPVEEVPEEEELTAEEALAIILGEEETQ